MPPATEPLRIFRSFRANYYEDDILRGPEAYPESYFAELTANGFNAVWLRGILRNLVDAAPFPGIGDEPARHRAALAEVVARAQAHGVRVLLYLNEPLCFPAGHPFWQAHPELRGDHGDSSMDEWYDTYALCTSTPAVQAWLRNAMRELFRAVPDLGGWFLISASEHHTHCYSHAWGAHEGRKPACPRCAARTPAEVTAELITLLRDGTRDASPDALCIAWNWSWDILEKDPQPELLARLPRDAIVLGDWERGGTVTMPGGRQNWRDEYSLSYIGPTRRFIRLRDEARRHGLRVMAKLQVGTTHELATVPNLPLLDNLYEKLARTEAAGMHGILATWNFGNSFSANTAALARFYRNPDRPGPRVFVEQFAADYFPGADATGVGEAVERFSCAMRHYPYSMPLLYFGPMNYALAYPLTTAPLTGKPLGRSWVMDERGDDLAPACRDFTPEETIAQFRAVLAEWEPAVAVLEKALAGCEHPRARAELANARLVGLCFRSTVNVFRTWLLRRDRPASLESDFAEIARDELAAVAAALPLVEADPRFGFHAECQRYMFTAEQLRRKLAELRAALR